MNNNDKSMYLTTDECKKLMEKIDLDKLFDNLMVEYKKKTNTKKVVLVRKDN